MKKFLPLIILFAILIPSFVFTIDEREQAIITEFGEFKRSVIKPGIHFKKPFIEKISRFEKRIDGKLEDFKTRRQLNYFRDIGSRK